MLIYFEIFVSVFFSAEDKTFKGQETLSDSDYLILQYFSTVWHTMLFKSLSF